MAAHAKPSPNKKWENQTKECKSETASAEPYENGSTSGNDLLNLGETAHGPKSDSRPLLVQRGEVRTENKKERDKKY